MSQRNTTRRRGDLLLESIYDAATEIIREQGYANLTFVEIARLAQTSRTVLYRRWGTPLNLVHEILVYRASKALDGELIDKIRDTGSLRGDLLYLMELYQKIYIAAGPEVMTAMLFEISRNNAEIPAISGNAVFKNIQMMEKIIAFAKARGEKIKTLSPSALTLPFDLIRIRNLWGLHVFDQAALEQLVDEILLPVLTK